MIHNFMLKFFISQPKVMLWVLKRTVSLRQLFGHSKHMFKLMDKKVFIHGFILKIFHLY